MVEQEFAISEESRDGATVVTVSGEVDVETAPALKERLDQVDRSAGEQAVVVDLTAVTFIDSTGLGALIGVRKQCVEAGRDLRLVVGEPRILRVFEITALAELFSIHPSLDLALTA